MKQIAKYWLWQITKIIVLLFPIGVYLIMASYLAPSIHLEGTILTKASVLQADLGSVNFAQAFGDRAPLTKVI